MQHSIKSPYVTDEEDNTLKNDIRRKRKLRRSLSHRIQQAAPPVVHFLSSLVTLCFIIFYFIVKLKSTKNLEIDYNFINNVLP